MADDNLPGDEENYDDDADFGGLGSLPPLSEFDSEPASSDTGDEDSPMGGLPPISELSVETPSPTGGNIRATPPEYADASDFDTPVSDGNLDTPEPPASDAMSFQDLAADSDFSPETPEIGPGPDSDIDTPMFDSAFGGGGDFDSGGSDTPAPTRAMETPMFTNASGGDMFGGTPAGGVSGGGFDAGTPIPDFSPDTNAPSAAAGMSMAAAPAPSRRGGGILSTLVVGSIALLIGLAIAPFNTFVALPWDSNATKLAEKDGTISDLQAKVTKYESAINAGSGAGTLTPEEISALVEKKNNLDSQIAAAEDKLGQSIADLDDKVETVQQLEADIEAKTQEYRDVEEEFQSLENEMALVNARYEGLSSEVGRLSEQVGLLEDANTRRLMTKETLEHNIDRLLILVKEGLPLTPPKYNREERIGAVQALKDRVIAAKWVEPALLDSYTSLYESELSISASTEYFVARIPVEDRFGTVSRKWAECLMDGNKRVYYMTIDGVNAGVYQSNGEGAAAQFEFSNALSEQGQAEIREKITNSRIDDYELLLEKLGHKQAVTEKDTPLQKLFGSLVRS